MEYKILDHQWRSARYTVGFVAYATENPANPGEWNSVVGYAPELDEDSFTFGGESEDVDLQYIAAHGAKLSVEEAEVFFPRLDITKHKYYRE